jgi:rhamnose transport system permease protein
MLAAEHRPAVSLLVFFAAVAAVMALVAPAFFTAQNFFDIGANAAYVAIAGMGMLAVILIGQIDVSVGAILAICCAICGALAKAGVGLVWLVPLSVGIGALLGALNGLLVAGLGVHSIVVTLGMLNVYRGALIVGTQGVWITGLPADFRWLGDGALGPLPVSVIVAALVAAGLWLLLSRLSAGRHFYVVGSNPEGARVAGIDVARTQVLAFALCGATVGLAALVYAGRFGGVESNTGQGFELVVISAVVLGGANIFGGSGTLLGTLLGAVMISTLGTVLIFLGVDAVWEQAVQGVLILLAVLYYTLQRAGPVPALPRGLRGGAA